jgi:hypothetical protein
MEDYGIVKWMRIGYNKASKLTDKLTGYLFSKSQTTRFVIFGLWTMAGIFCVAARNESTVAGLIALFYMAWATSKDKYTEE